MNEFAAADSTAMAKPADSTVIAESADSTVIAEREASAGATVPGRLRSAAGFYLLATAVNQPGPVDLHPDHPARVVFYCAFETAVRRRFRADSPTADIVRTVANAARRHPFVPMDALAAEMLVRDALGEVVPVEELPLPVIVATHLVVFAAICDELALTDEEIDILIAPAEKQAERLR